MKIFDDKPNEIEVVSDGLVMTGFHLREAIAEIEILAEAASNDGVEPKTRKAWKADETSVAGLAIRNYAAKVSAIIRARYSTDAELAIQRQRDTKPKDFAEYFEFCERVKLSVQATETTE